VTERGARREGQHTPFALPLAFLELARWHSAIGAGLAVWVGGRMAGALWGWDWLHPMSIAILLSAAGNAYNDTTDVEADALNRPTRPIPRGAMTIRQAQGFALGCAALAFLLALPLGAATVVGTLTGIVLLFGYSPFLKSIPIVGNGIVGLLVGMCVGFGGLVAGNIPAVVLPGVALGLLFGGRELLKTLYDVAGDRAMGVATVATRWGERATLGIATACFGTAILVWGLWAGSQPSLWIVPILTTLLVAAVLLPLWRHPTRERTHLALRGSKLLGLALLLLLSFL
jgi:geranylgeranylglycerol-phosphate geranylgeranyltransferase